MSVPPALLLLLLLLLFLFLAALAAIAATALGLFMLAVLLVNPVVTGELFGPPVTTPAKLPCSFCPYPTKLPCSIDALTASCSA